MILIYSNKKTGLNGKHIDPKKFSGMACRVAKEVYTDDEKIKSIYEKIDIKVFPLPKEETKKTKKDEE
jgi:hypothetical protein